MTLALTRTTSLLKEPCLSIVIAKSALRLGDCHRLNKVEIDDLYYNIIHYTMESALCVYMAEECNKAIR